MMHDVAKQRGAASVGRGTTHDTSGGRNQLISSSEV
jgi:hypothetical protein